MTRDRTFARRSLQAIVEVARASVPRFDEVRISTLHNGAKVQTRAATGDLVHQLDDQYGPGEGPCVDTLRHACGRGPADPPRPTLAPRRSRSRRARTALAARGQALPRRPRHPRWVEPVLDNLRRRPEAEGTAELFAAHAAIALGNAREREHLNQALHSRKVIGQAVGILMERYAMKEDRA